MSIEEALAILEGMRGTIFDVWRDAERLLICGTPDVGERFDSLSYKIQLIEANSKVLFEQLGDAVRQAQEAA